MTDWVHCNVCFHQPGDGRKFSLTNCGHIYCELCLNDGTTGMCIMCKCPCTTIILSAKMKPEVEIFFTDPAELVKKQQKQLLQIMDFQNNHRRRLLSYIREKFSQQKQMLDVSQKASSQAQELSKDVNRLREENNYLKKLINDKGISGNVNRTRSPGAISGFKSSPNSLRSHQQNNSAAYMQSMQSAHSMQHSQAQMRVHGGADIGDTLSTPAAKIPSSPNQQLHPGAPGSTPYGDLSPSGPPRILVRTPPSGGHIGVAQGHNGSRASNLPHGSVNSPGHHNAQKQNPEQHHHQQQLMSESQVPTYLTQTPVKNLTPHVPIDARAPPNHGLNSSLASFRVSSQAS